MLLLWISVKRTIREQEHIVGCLTKGGGGGKMLRVLRAMYISVVASVRVDAG